ncbi:hypothetical protein [Autumnicola psychrophila]|uniref:Glycosyltransferase n=1 Tax=Autumnicola psychrophila TaxID=3075592 RepID=A0ABU3DQR3_9FLAO|nr:hypothetical protein [Zunongwangia sp. F225]MDT0686058.1 hypothetical protein [Zunongwangia sp. F225]
MKILFVCGSMEPGKDGVGDYTRRLAIQLKKKNYTTAILAIDDRYINQPVLQKQCSDKSSIEVFRIPYNYTIADARQWILNFGAEIYSLQYVPYSFADRGIHLGLSNKLLKISRNGKWHVMLHELWIGMESRKSKKEKLIGYFQKRMINNFLKNLQPFIITTQTELYSISLKNLGYKVFKLPLFSNVPIKLDMQIECSERESGNIENIKFIVFGMIQRESLIKQFTSQIVEYQKKHKKQFELIIVGQEHEEQKKWFKLWKMNNLKVKLLGSRNTEEISKLMHSAHLGLSTTPLPKIEKSGSVAAMREHGLKVICLSADNRVAQAADIDSKVENIYEFLNITLEEILKNGIDKTKVFSGIDDIITKFQKLITTEQ